MSKIYIIKIAVLGARPSISPVPAAPSHHIALALTLADLVGDESSGGKLISHSGVSYRLGLGSSYSS